MKLKVIVFFFFMAVFLGLITFASITVLNQATGLVNNVRLKEMVEHITTLKQKVSEILLEQHSDTVKALAVEMNQSFDASYKAVSEGPKHFSEATHAPLNEVLVQLEEVKVLKDKIIISMNADVEAQATLKELEFDFVGEFVDFLGSDEAVEDIEGQVTVAEALMGILKAGSEKELLASRLLFKTSMADYRKKELIDKETSEELTERFQEYSTIKEKMFQNRKERSYVIEDIMKALIVSKASVDSVRKISSNQINDTVGTIKKAFVAGTAVFSLVFFIVALLLIQRSIVRPILLLQSASLEVSKGNFARVSDIKQKDEIGDLAGNFNGMVDKLETTLDEIKHINANLEGMVEERTEQINRILNNVTAGFCIINEEGIIQPGFTKSCYALFGATFEEGRNITAVLKLNDRDADHFLIMLEQVFEDIVDADLTLDQIPKEFQLENKWITLEPKEIRNKQDEIESILFTMVDSTELQLARQKADLNETLITISNKRYTFSKFIKDFRGSVSELTDLLVGKKKEDMSKEELEALKQSVARTLHTVKGNFSVFTMKNLADDVHHLEDKEELSLEDIARMEAAFKDFLSEHEKVIKFDYEDTGHNKIEIDTAQIASLEEFLNGNGRNMKSDELMAHIKNWVGELKKVRVEDIFGPMGDFTEKTGRRLGKKVHFKLEGADVRVSADVMNPVAQVMPHLIRNSLDHGIESKGARKRQGKAEFAEIKLSVELEENEYKIMVEDDGRGIDVDKIVNKAVFMNVVKAEEAEKMTDKEKIYLIFHDSLSTSDEISDLSGRGVGMSAVKHTVENWGGTIDLESEVGKGTQIIIKIPFDSLKKNVTNEANPVKIDLVS